MGDSGASAIAANEKTGNTTPHHATVFQLKKLPRPYTNKIPNEYDTNGMPTKKPRKYFYENFNLLKPSAVCLIFRNYSKLYLVSWPVKSQQVKSVQEKNIQINTEIMHEEEGEVMNCVFGSGQVRRNLHNVDVKRYYTSFFLLLSLLFHENGNI